MASTEGTVGESRAPLRLDSLLLLAGLAFVLVFLALEPYLSYALFGSDSGEYYRLTVDLISTGTLPHGAAYAGWGSAYPDFPGIYLVAGAASGALGVDAFSSLAVVIPVIAVLSVFPLFLLFRRIYPQDTVALLAAAVASIAMPRLFSIAHPAPLALGDFLCVGCLWMLVESRRDIRWYLPLSLTGGALILTHHLSSYFFAVSALGGILLLELWRPGLWSRRFPTRELLFIAAFLTGTFLFWFYGTTTFVAKVLDFALGQHIGFALFEAIGLGAVLVAGLLVRWRRGLPRPTRAWVRLPSDRSWLRDALAICAVVFAAIFVIVFVPVPGTTQVTTPAAILWFSPVLLLGLATSGSRRMLSPSRLGPFALAWTGALGLSALAMIVLSVVAPAFPTSPAAGISSTLSPYRHVEYLFIPIGLLAAVGLARVVTRIRDRAGQRAFFAACVAVVVVLAANAAIVYPPQNDFGGFEEGLTHADAALWMWVGMAMPANWTVASDHRLSSMIFGFDGNPATWSSTPALFTGDNWSAAVAELRSSGTPYTDRPIDLVAVDSVMHSGVALDPSKPAHAMSPSAIAWFGALPFVPLYENGQNVVYVVDSSYLSGG
ncbi:MAG TPA: hypothetical protein VEG66_04120 [Thermoplasmata archaeon]|jgi:hypothetical protein|nr:hypothetical protein [Thermoplasmata archaeon]